MTKTATDKYLYIRYIYLVEQASCCAKTVTVVLSYIFDLHVECGKSWPRPISGYKPRAHCTVVQLKKLPRQESLSSKWFSFLLVRESKLLVITVLSSNDHLIAATFIECNMSFTVGKRYHSLARIFVSTIAAYFAKQL